MTDKVTEFLDGIEKEMEYSCALEIPAGEAEKLIALARHAVEFGKEIKEHEEIHDVYSPDSGCFVNHQFEKKLEAYKKTVESLGK